MDKDIYIILDNIKYAQNIGPIFRLADAFQIKKIYLCRNNMRRMKNELNCTQQRILHKASRGATEWVDWEFRDSCRDLIEELKARNISIVGIETGNNSQFIDKIEFKYPLALVFGAEDHGIAPEIMELTDFLVKIPMEGKGRSLNVSTTVSIAVYEALRRKII